MWGQSSPPEGTYTALSIGYDHSCALTEDGEIVCWGINRYGNTDVPDALQQPGAVAVSNE